MKLCFSCREHDFFKCRRCAGFFPRSEVERDGIYFLCRRCFEYERYIASDDDIEAEVDVCDEEDVYAYEVDEPDCDDTAENIFDIGTISHVVNEIATFALLHKLSENEEQPRRRHRRTDSYREHCDCDRECDCDF